ncbi:YheC/YheD family protein [Mycoplasmatota bacterium]|nr:YheC/YheD family protein [Mycoplasmatota bacterium]
MIIIGMLHHRKDPGKVRKSYSYAVVAKAEGAELLYFSPKAVDFKKRRIYGYFYREGKWERVESRFPDVIYNTGSPEKFKQSDSIIRQLKEIIPFTTHSIGNKISVYNRLKEDGTFSHYLIPTHIIYSLNHFIKHLEMYHNLVIKPVNGHKGQDITFIEPKEEKYYLHSEDEETLLNKDELLDYVSKKLKEEKYLIQPYINCKTKTGNAYDFRLHTQKNGEGKWVITAIYPRISPPGSIVSNISNGGSTNYLVPFLKQEYGEKYYDIKQYLEHFSIKLSKKMDELQLKFFNETIDELGIDAGLDDMNKIWIFEVNWRPGCPPTFYLELDVVKNTINYAIYLAKNQRVNR